MKRIQVYCFLLLFALGLTHQVKSQVIEASSGDTLNSLVSLDVQYAFDEFCEGNVFFKSGATTKAKLNYSYLMNEMQFIDEGAGEILTLNDIPDISIVLIESRLFVTVGGTEFMELLTKGDVRLAVNRRAKALSLGRTGAYGMVNTTSSITSYSDYELDGQMKSLNVKDNIKITTDRLYYLYKDGGKTLVKGVKSYLKVYPKEKGTEIERYVSANKVDFKKEADLIKLTEYCNQL